LLAYCFGFVGYLLFKDLAVIPRPYPIVGQAPHAVVVPKQEPFEKGEVLRIIRGLCQRIICLAFSSKFQKSRARAQEK
jgi:hypothetical protein